MSCCVTSNWRYDTVEVFQPLCNGNLSVTKYPPICVENIWGWLQPVVNIASSGFLQSSCQHASKPFVAWFLVNKKLKWSIHWVFVIFGVAVFVISKFSFYQRSILGPLPPNFPEDPTVRLWHGNWFYKLICRLQTWNPTELTHHCANLNPNLQQKHANRPLPFRGRSWKTWGSKRSLVAHHHVSERSTANICKHHLQTLVLLESGINFKASKPYGLKNLVGIRHATMLANLLGRMLFTRRSTEVIKRSCGVAVKKGEKEISVSAGEQSHTLIHRSSNMRHFWSIMALRTLPIGPFWSFLNNLCPTALKQFAARKPKKGGWECYWPKRALRDCEGSLIGLCVARLSLAVTAFSCDSWLFWVRLVGPEVGWYW